jgi:hypothetical protein
MREGQDEKGHAMAEVSSTFILRLWTVDEAPAGGRSPRRGRVDHPQSGDHLYFNHMLEALAFIRSHFGAYDRLFPPPTGAMAENTQDTAVAREGGI